MFRQMLASSLGVTLVLLIILLVYQLGAELGRAASMQLPRSIVLQLFGLGAVENLGILLPFGLMLGIMLALGRMYHESEMTAAQACGLSLRRVIVPVLLLALPASAAGAWLGLDLAPRSTAYKYELRVSAMRKALSVPLTAGQFRTLDGGRAVVYARTVNAAGELGDVFVKRSSGRLVETTLARRARQSTASDGTQSIVLYDGERHEGVPGSRRYQIVRFAEQHVPLPAAVLSGAQGISAQPSAVLLQRSDREARAELQWRLALPVMSLVLGLCAVPLARLRPRQGRFARTWQGVLLFALYANLASAAVVWLQRGSLPAMPGLWLVHLAFALFVLWLAVSPGLLRRMGRAR